VISQSGADIIGLQEALLHQVSYLDSVATDFDWIGVGRDDGHIRGEYSPILFDSTKWQVLEWNTRWLSQTPDSIGVAGWDAALPRIATVALFQDRATGVTLRVINTHFDHRGPKARLESAKLIREWALEGNGPVLVLGDFNIPPEDAPYSELIQPVDGRVLYDVASNDTTSTFKGFDALNPVTGARIDYIFSAGHLDSMELEEGLAYRVIVSERNGRFVSDHTPVVASIRY